jgi:hypothetical protein
MRFAQKLSIQINMSDTLAKLKLVKKTASISRNDATVRCLNQILLRKSGKNFHRASKNVAFLLIKGLRAGPPRGESQFFDRI